MGDTMTKASAIYGFWSSFGTAYEENAVPDNAVMPYITYDVTFSEFGESVLMGASLWQRSPSWVSINAWAQTISDAIGRGGKIIPCDDGAIWIKREPNFAQPLGDDNDNMVKRIIISISVDYLTED